MSDKLVGFVWCHGNRDFTCWETDGLSEEDQAAIEEILSKYDTCGTSETDVYDWKFSDVFSENYGVVRKVKETDLDARERAIYLYARGFFDAYCPYEEESDGDYSAYNFRQMWETDFKDSHDDENLKDWLKDIISMWPSDLCVIPAKKEELQ